MSHKERLSNWAECFCWSFHETISIILDEYTAAGGDAAARFNLQIKITLFKMELRVPLLFPYHLEVNLDEPWLEISHSHRLGPFAD